MSQNSIGGVLASATVLPATSALAVFMTSKSHPVIIVSLIGINVIVLAITVARMSRYLINIKRS